MEEQYIKMDYNNFVTPEERIARVNEIIASTPKHKLTPSYLEKMADYIIDAASKEEEKNTYITKNHMVTVSERETSFEGLVGKLENGEDGIYNMITNDKNIIFKPKNPITEEDVSSIPDLAELRKAISVIEAQFTNARGKRAKLLLKQLKEMRSDQYVIRGAYKKPIYCMNKIKSFTRLDLSENITIDKDGVVSSDGLLSMFNPDHISCVLQNYSKLKEDSYDNFSGDSKWFMMDFDNLVDAALKDKYPIYYKILIYKIDGKTNAEIQSLIKEEFGSTYSIEYLSSLWCNKIPKLIAETASDQYLNWYYTFEEKGQWKKCSRCGQIKLAHNRYFSKNSTSKDKFYSICKECRNKK